MTRRDYVRIAEALNACRGECAEAGVMALGGWATARDTICAALAEDNKRFDRQRFIAATLGFHKVV